MLWKRLAGRPDGRDSMTPARRAAGRQTSNWNRKAALKWCLKWSFAIIVLAITATSTWQQAGSSEDARRVSVEGDN
jgi:hypothetical protein